MCGVFQNLNIQQTHSVFYSPSTARSFIAKVGWYEQCIKQYLYLYKVGDGSWFGWR